MSEFLPTCEYAAREAGKILLDWQGRFQVKEKGRADLVTEADLAAQQAIHKIIQAKYPEHQFLGEEQDPLAPTNSDSEYRWIVDPLDGTTNYVHGLANYSVSIALEYQGELIAGVVYDPVHDKCFSASKGGGAFLNGTKLSVSQAQNLEESLVAASFAAGIDRDSKEIQQFIEVLVRCQAVRRLGSAALNLAYVAAGQLDAYWAASVKIWDVAAGILIVKEAGGIVEKLGGGPVDPAAPKIVATSSKSLQDELQTTLN